MVRICTLNVRGLRDGKKRRRIFTFLKSKKIDIAMLQETHSTPEIEQLWNNEWGGQVLYSHHNSSSRGVMILVSGNINTTLTLKDNSGRYIATTIEINGQTKQLLNIYAPNSEAEQIAFFRELHEKIATSLDINTLIVGGDFNVHLEAIDKKGGQNTVKKSRPILNLLIQDNNLKDIWRMLHPGKICFTWEQNTKEIFCRLDYFLASTQLLKSIETCEISTSILTDHKLVVMSMNDKITNDRGPGFWKFNNSLLTDPTYCDKIKHVIRDVWRDNTDLHDLRVKWDYLKFKIQCSTAEYSKKKAKARHDLQKEITTQMDKLFDEKCVHTLSPTQESEYKSLQRILEDLNDYKEQGAQIRSKVEFIENNEKSNKYFYNQEKKAFERKTITQLDIDGNIIKDQKSILSNLEAYYKNLFESKISTLTNKVEQIPNMSECNENQKQTCEKSINMSEAYAALAKMNKGKSPGCDGLTVEFYNCFWHTLGEKLVDVLNFSEKQNPPELPTSMKRGVITLLHKKDRDPIYIKNWRPVSLLNIDYKIYTKCLALRMQDNISSIIHDDQKGFIKGRYIGENIRQIQDTIEYANKKDITGLLLLLDFEKAFDSIEWSYIDNILELFNFGPTFRRLVKLCYTNVSSTVLNNGYSSGWFLVKRGVRQGCPLSSFLFLLCIEYLAQLIRNNKNVNGISIGGVEIKLSLFADDASCIIKNEESLTHIFAITEKFSKYSGLKLNIDKSLLFYIGPWKTKHQSVQGVPVCSDSFNALGIEIGNDEIICYDKNYTEKIEKLKRRLGMWSTRRLTLMGKVLIAKSYGISNLIYSMSCTDCTTKTLKEAQKCINNFIWSNKPPKIKHSVMIQDNDRWGLKAPDLINMQKSLRLAWISRLLEPKHRVIDTIFEKYGGLSLLLHSNYDFKKLDIPAFYAAIFEFFTEIHDQSKFKGILWNNRHVTVNKQPVFYREWHEKGVKYVRDLIENNKVLPKKEIEQRFKLDTIDLGIYRAIKSCINKMIRQNQTCISTEYTIKLSTNYEIDGKILNLQLAKCKDYYAMLTYNATETPTAMGYWNRLGFTIADPQWNSFIMAKNSCKESSPLALQYRLIHNILPCNENLHKWKIRTDSECAHCSQTETILHMFVECKHIQQYLKEIADLINIPLFTEAIKDKNTVIFGSQDRQINNLLLLTKMFFYDIRMSGTKFNPTDFKNEIAYRMQVDKKKCSSRAYIGKWGNLEHIYKNSVCDKISQTVPC